MPQEKPRPNILLVDDSKENLLALENLLEGLEVNRFAATGGNQALSLMLQHDFALVLLDVQMPEMDGFEVAELMRGSERTRRIPIIFMTAYRKEKVHLFKGYEAGAVDYLFKPLDTHILKSKVAVFLKLYQRQQALERYAAKLKQAVLELKASKAVIEKQNRKLVHLSSHDGLTGLYNYRHMEKVLEHEFTRALRYKTDLSCMLIDLDFFKDVNDNFGHRFGDFVLKTFALRLKKHIRESDFAFRYGGEEFLILLPNTAILGAQKTAGKILSLCRTTPFTKNDLSTVVTVSIGVASIEYNGPQKPSELIAFADQALYRAKAEGRNRVKIHSAETLMPEKEAGGDENTQFRFVFDQISMLMEKTKKGSINQLELLVRDMRGQQFGSHSRKVSEFIDLIGKKLGLPKVSLDPFKQAAILHDCFNTLLSDGPLASKEMLSEEEWAQIEDHPYMLGELTRLFDFFSHERNILLYHHERFDGTGYPEGLRGDGIPLGARIFAIADSLVAMTSDRPYRKRLPVEKIINELVDNSGTQFDPALVSLFLDVLQENGLFSVAPDFMQKAKERVNKAFVKS